MTAAMLDHPPMLGDHPLTTSWRIRRQTLFLYEVDADELVKLVPASLSLQEVRPGVGLFAVETLQYLPGHFGETTESFELVVSVLIEPDLGVAMPLPRFSLFVVSVISSSAAFVERERVLLRTPMDHTPDLRMAFAADGTSVDVTDGVLPVLSCRNTFTTPAPTFEPKVSWGLVFTNKDDQLHQGAFRWEGQVFEHQRPGDHGRFHDHPVFRGLDLRRIRGCYRQMAARPELPTKIGYYHLGPSRPHRSTTKGSPR